MVGVALIAFFAVFADSAKASVRETVLEVFPADLTIQSVNPGDELPAPFSPAITEQMRLLPELDVVSAMQFGWVIIDGTEEPVGAVDPGTIDEVFALKPVGPALTNLSRVNTIMVSATALEERGWSVGQEIQIRYALTGAVATSIAGVFDGDDFADFYISSGTYAANFTPIGDGLVFARAAPNVTVEQAQQAVTSITDEFATVKVQTKSELIEDVENQVDTALSFFSGLVLLAVLIAILGITNTLALSIYERTREIGLLRAVGMDRRQVRRMVRWESVIIALFGAVLGVVLGIFLGWAVTRALADEGLGAFSIPIVQVIAALIIAGIGGVIAAIWPAWKASKLNVLEAISYE